MRSLRWLVAAGLAAMLAGCMVGPDYTKPDISTPQTWTEASTPGGISADARWWDAFQDDILAKLVQESTAQNLDVAQAVDRLAEARANLGATRSGLFPTLDASASGTASRGVSYGVAGNSMNSTSVSTSSDTSVSTSVSTSVGIDASWELDLWGKTRRSVEAYKAEAEAAEADVRSARLSVVGDVAKAYVDLRTAQKRMQVGEAAVGRYRDTLVLTQARLNANLVSESDVFKAKGSLAAAEANLPPLRSAAAEARHKLAVLMARSPTDLDSWLGIGGALPRFQGAIDTGIPADLLRRRPDVVKSERKLAAATARIGVEQAKLLPAISLTGNIGASQTNIGGVSIGVPGTWSIGPSITMPIFNAGKLGYQKDAAVAQANQAAGAYRASVLAALQDVENAFANYRADRQKVVTLATAVANYGLALKLAKDLYSRGLTSFLDVLEAEQSLYSNQDSLAVVEGQVLKDIVAIFKGLGGGW
ncbi:efflux transporter outer membrane subunit [Reyranella sp.]|uniref:efflux transporter outer membrane subunit n=1 Tax=Reyranella sp. TaxID=1929291 RepID=UPI003BA91810